MTQEIFQTPQYRKLIQSHIFETIAYLFEKNQEFGVACEIAHITFEPELPSVIKDSFDETVLFMLSGYTFESAKLEEDAFVFEAGFGSDNFGSVVWVPLLAIKQLFVGDTPIVFNLATPVAKSKAPQEDEKSSSMEAFLNNPENQKLLKKKR